MSICEWRFPFTGTWRIRLLPKKYRRGLDIDPDFSGARAPPSAGHVFDSQWPLVGRNFSKLGGYSLSVWEAYIRWAVPEIVNCLAKPADAVRYRVSRVRWHR